MCVQVGNLIFDDWINLKLFGGWQDTFIFRVATDAGLPPGDYAEVLRGVAASLRKLRPGAAIWVQIRNPARMKAGLQETSLSGDGAEGDLRLSGIEDNGEMWYPTELKYAMRFARLPVAVTTDGVVPSIWDFTYFPAAKESPTARPPAGKPYLSEGDYRATELNTLRVLARADCATTIEVASLAGYSPDRARRALSRLAERRLVSHVITGKYPLWKIRRSGVSVALRSWGHPPGRAFRRRKERGRDACRERVPDNSGPPRTERKKELVFYRGGKKVTFLARERSTSNRFVRAPRFGRHRRTARLWPAWLRQAWSQAEIWAGWTEVSCGRGRPDALCWGQLGGVETLFWLEVESGHDSRRDIQRKMIYRINRALMYARRSSARVVFAFLAPYWVREAAIQIVRELPGDLAVVFQDWKAFGELPLPRWGRVSWAP